MSINILELEATLPHEYIRYPLPQNTPKQGKKGLQALVGKKKNCSSVGNLTKKKHFDNMSPNIIASAIFTTLVFPFEGDQCSNVVLLLQL